MSESNASTIDPGEAAERFDPATMRGKIIESEHLARYRWACRFARGRRTLDAGCGYAYGSVLLADAGEASTVVGIDRAEEVLTAARARVPLAVRLVPGDVTRLPFEDDAFDLVVCFEVLEHLDDPNKALDEFRRVLAPGGLLAVSSPNRDVYTPGNPHHVHEYLPEELRGALAARFDQVALRRQGTWIVSGVLDDEQFSRGADAQIDAAEVRKLLPDEPGKEIYTVAVAGDQLPTDGPVFELNVPVELRRWDDLWQAQRQELERQAEVLAEVTGALDTGYERAWKELSGDLQERFAEISELRRELIASEKRLSHVHDLEAQVHELNRINDELSAKSDGLEPELEQLKRAYAMVVGSVSWRVTAPLRGAVARLRRGH